MNGTVRVSVSSELAEPIQPEVYNLLEVAEVAMIEHEVKVTLLGMEDTLTIRIEFDPPLVEKRA